MIRSKNRKYCHTYAKKKGINNPMPIKNAKKVVMIPKITETPCAAGRILAKITDMEIKQLRNTKKNIRLREIRRYNARDPMYGFILGSDLLNACLILIFLFLITSKNMMFWTRTTNKRATKARKKAKKITSTLWEKSANAIRTVAIQTKVTVDNRKIYRIFRNLS